jgi:hypothetical protein
LNSVEVLVDDVPEIARTSTYRRFGRTYLTGACMTLFRGLLQQAF